MKQPGLRVLDGLRGSESRFSLAGGLVLLDACDPLRLKVRRENEIALRRRSWLWLVPKSRANNEHLLDDVIQSFLESASLAWCTLYDVAS